MTCEPLQCMCWEQPVSVVYMGYIIHYIAYTVYCDSQFSVLHPLQATR